MIDALVPSRTTRVIVWLEPISMRWGGDRLRRFCREELEIEPDPTTSFLFVNKARDTLLLYSTDDDGDQTVLKKLDRGAFLLPTPDDDARFLEMTPSMLPRLFRDP